MMDQEDFHVIGDILLISSEYRTILLTWIGKEITSVGDFHEN